MNVLGVETAQSACSVAVRTAGRLVASRSAATGQTQAERLLPMIAEALADAHLVYGDIHLLAVGVGPGLFTGVRVGLAAVRGLRLVLRVPAIGVSTLHAVAASALASSRGATMYVVNDARNDEVYAQPFTADAAPLGEASLMTLEAAAAACPSGAVLLGTAAALVAAHVRPTPRTLSGYGMADAAIVAALAEARALSAGFDDPGPPRPLYVRKPHARTLAAAKR
jgi:tRNA threonylcarbamoyl adenosine modification protein YeaZ